MSRLVKDYIEIDDYSSLDALIARLTELRESLPDGVEAELKMRGDDVFGRHLSVAYFRPQTDEEAACDARYANPGTTSKERPGRLRRAA